MGFYAAYVMLNLAGAITAGTLAIYALQHQYLTASRTFAFWMLCAAIWAGSAGLSAISNTPEQAVFWMYPVRYTGIMFATSALVFFALDYTKNWQNLTRWHVLFLIGIPLITVSLVWIPNHNLFWRDLETIRIGTYWFAVGGTPNVGYWGYVFAGFIFGSYALLILLRHVYLGLEYYRWRVIAIISGTLISMVASLWVTIQFQIGIHIDIAASTIFVSALAWGALMFRNQLLEMMPIAYSAIVKQVADAVIVLDAEGCIVELNQAAIDFVGEKPSWIIGKPITQVLPHYPALLDYQQTKHLRSTQITVEHENSHQYYEAKIAPLYDDKRSIIGYLITLNDVTNRYLAEQQRILIATERHRMEILNEFLSDVSHDLRTPLTSLKTSIYLLKKIYGEQELERLERMDFDIKRLNQLIDDMFATIKLDTVKTNSKTFHQVNDLLRQAIETVKVKFTDRSHKFELQLDQHLPHLQCNGQQILQAFEQVLSNAVLYSEPHTKITIKTQVLSQHVIVEVSDQGMGIANAEKSKIFQHFYRVDTARSVDTGGTGLGLSMVKRIINLHNGTIELDSQLNEGSTFRFIFPIQQPLSQPV